METEEKNTVKPKINKVRFLNNSIKFFMIRIKKNKETLETSYKGFRKLMENQIRLEEGKEKEYGELLKIFDKVYELFSDEEIRGIITKNGITAEQFVSKFGERILGDNNRTYNMSELFNESLIAKRNDGTDSRNIKYMAKPGIERSFKNFEGKQVVIQEIGILYYEEWNKIRNRVSKYRVMTQISENDYRVDEIFSNINISRMEEPEYKEAVLEELLSSNNIQLSNGKGYVGEIEPVQCNVKKLEIGQEEKETGSYTYRINDKYSLTYNNDALTAVILNSKEPTIESMNKEDNLGDNSYDERK